MPICSVYWYNNIQNVVLLYQLFCFTGLLLVKSWSPFVPFSAAVFYFRPLPQGQGAFLLGVLDTVLVAGFSNTARRSFADLIRPSPYSPLYSIPAAIKSMFSVDAWHSSGACPLRANWRQNGYLCCRCAIQCYVNRKAPNGGLCPGKSGANHPQMHRPESGRPLPICRETGPCAITEKPCGKPAGLSFCQSYSHSMGDFWLCRYIVVAGTNTKMSIFSKNWTKIAPKRSVNMPFWFLCLKVIVSFTTTVS